MSVEELKNLIIKYELALRAMEEAYQQAVDGENCGFGRPYLTPQEQASEFAWKTQEEVREEAAKLGIEMPPMSEFDYRKDLERPSYQERMQRIAELKKSEEMKATVTDNQQ